MEEHEQDLTEQGESRRRFLRQAGTVAWATPFIVTMMSRTALAQDAPCGIVDIDEGVCVTTTPCGSGLVCRLVSIVCRCQA